MNGTPRANPGAPVESDEQFPGMYRRFEDRFRGTEEQITRRLEIYLPLLAGLPQTFKTQRVALDIGCGRGEWLKLLHANGWQVQGVDSSAQMLGTTRSAGIPVAHADALEWLCAQPDGSVGVLSAFHVVEHVPIEYLIRVLHESRRALADGGILILETPNPENLNVGTWGFFTDPTHIKPLPPPLLHFLVEDTGLSPAYVFRLNGEVAASTEDLAATFSQLFTASYDYAVIARKPDRSAAPDAPETALIADFVARTGQPNPMDVTVVLAAMRALQTAVAELQERFGPSTRELAAGFTALQASLGARLKSQEQLLESSMGILERHVETRIRAVINHFEGAIAERDRQIAELQVGLFDRISGKLSASLARWRK